ncbi:MAG TPA: phosphatidylinositol mannoside acyltransferase [Mycobacteriales bacterium]
MSRAKVDDGVRGRLQDLAYAAGWWAVKVLPRRLTERVFRKAADIAFRRRGPGVRRLAANLRRVVGPDVDEATHDDLVRRGMQSYARYWLETFRLPVMDKPAVVARISMSRQEIFDAARADGRGLILALPHIGNWDVSGIWLVAQGEPFTTVAERLKPESLYQRFVDYREGLGMEVLPLEGGDRNPAEVLAERLRAGGVVCLLADRDLSAAGVPVTFFGEATRMPAGPALLAARTGAALIPVGQWFDGADWAITFHPRIELDGGLRLRDRVAAATQQLANAFETDIRAHPEDWHMLQRLWVADFGGDRALAPSVVARR